MANICDVQIIARGFKTKADLERCAEILEKCDTKSEAWTPLFEACVDTIPDQNTLTAYGWTKWSSTRLLDQDVANFKKDSKGIVSIEDLAERFDVFFEILGTECGCNVGEHFVIDPDGRMILEEYFDYNEYCTDEYSSYDEFVRRNGEKISKEVFDNSEGWVSTGEPETEFGEYINSLDFPSLT